MRRDVNVDDEQRDAQEHQQQAAPVDGDDREAEERGDERNCAKCPGQNHAGMKDLETDPGEAGKEEQREDVRVDQRVEQSCEEAKVHVVNLRAGDMERVAARLRLHAVCLLEQ